MKLFLSMLTFISVVSINAQAESDRKPNNQTRDFSCEQMNSGTAEFFIKLPEPLEQDRKLKGIELAVKAGGKTLFATKSASVFASDVVVSINATSGNKKFSGVIYLDELDQTSVSIKTGKKSRKSFQFDCNPSEE
jgi:hypothetical protein